MEIFEDKSENFRSLASKKFLKEKEVYFGKKIVKLYSAIDKNVSVMD